MEEAKDRVGEYSSSSTADLSEEKIARLKQAFAEADIFRIMKELPAEDAYRYQYSISEDGLVQFYEEALEIMEEPDRAKTAEMMRESLKDVEFQPGEIWISRGDMYLSRLLVNVSVAGSEDQAASSMALVLEQKNINKPLELQAPAGSRSLEEVMGSFMSGVLLGSGAPQGF